MRHTFIKKGVREIWANKVQYFFLILVLGLGIATYGSLYDMAETRGASLSAIYTESRFMDVQVMIEYGQTLNASVVDEVLSSPDLSGRIKASEYRLTFDVFINHTEEGRTKITRGLIMGYEAFDDTGRPSDLTVNRPLYYVDDPPWFSEPLARECFLEHKFARAYGFEPGDDLKIIKGPMEYDLKMLEDANIPEYFFVITEGSMLPSERSLGVIMVPIGVAMELYFGEEDGADRVNDIAILLNDPGDVDEFEDAVKAEFEKSGVVVKTIGKEENPARRFLYDDYENDKQNVATFPVIIFTISGFGLVMTLRRMIRTHRTQIGIFKSLGVPNRVILTYFLMIGLMIAVLGLIVGALLSIPLRMAFMSLIGNLLAFAIVRSSLAWEQYLIAGVIGFAITISCTVVPAWFALRIKPVDAIQSREGISKKAAGRMATRIGKKSDLPVPVKLTIRNFLRKPARTFTTIVGVGLSLSLFLGFMIAMNSVMVMIDQDAANTSWDYEITMDGFTPSNFTVLWNDSYPGIEYINPGILLPTRVWDDGDPEFCMVYALSDIRDAFDLDLKGGVADGEIVISRYISEKFSLKEGDELDMEIPSFDPGSGFSMERADIRISGIQENMMGYYLFMDLGAFQSMTGLDGLVNIIYLQVIDDEPIQELENMLITTPGVSSVVHVEDRENLLEQYFEIFVGTVYVMGVVSTILSLAIVYNLFMIDAHEKRRDYATMKTLGTSLRRIGYLIFIESGLVAIIGIALGAAGGMGLAYYMFAVADEWEVMNMRIVFTWPGFIAGSIMMIGVIVLVSFLTIRYISRINIANVIRERSTG